MYSFPTFSLNAGLPLLMMGWTGTGRLVIAGGVTLAVLGVAQVGLGARSMRQVARDYE